MNRHLIYVAGPPGVGKSTLAATLTAACARTNHLAPFAHDVLHPPTPPPLPGWTAVELGRRRDRFAGTDALSMSVQPKAVEWIRHTTHSLVLAEGDRLANLPFLTAADRAGFSVTLLVLDAPGHLLDARCAQRGSAQKASWRAGRATKTQRLAAHAEHTPIAVHRLDARQPAPVVLAAALMLAPALTHLHPPRGATTP